jgi:hypothetical protein
MPSTRKTRSPCFILRILGCFISLILIGSAVVACGNDAEEYRAGEMPMSPETVRKALETHTDELMSLPGVVGTGQGLCDNQPCIEVFVIKNSPHLEERIKKILEGYPVVIQETGHFRTRPEKLD